MAEQIICDQNRACGTVTCMDRLKEYQGEAPVILAKINGRLKELYHEVKKEDRLEFIPISDKDGMLAYRRTAVFMMLRVIRSLYPEHAPSLFVEFSLSKGLFCRFTDGFVPGTAELSAIEKEMHRLSDEKLSIVKRSIPTDEAIRLFGDAQMNYKERLFHFRRESRVNVYSLDSYQDYFYGHMAADTSVITMFGLYPYDDGFVLQLPTNREWKELPAFRPQHKLYRTLRDASDWSRKLDVVTIGDLNEKISRKEIVDLILIQEALMEKKMAQIAESIRENPDIRMVLIAGPSSSGKTTFSYRLSVQLRAAGLTPHPIAVDDYFVDRVNTPKDENGNYNYEDLEAIDVRQFNLDMKALMAGEKVALPTFNFVKGEREYKGNELQIGPEDILVVEGIHCLNDALTPMILPEQKFKIYISALTQLNVDEHNRIKTTDGRLIRRMVRDSMKRGTSAQKTIRMWDSVRKGEEKNIFPYQETADVMFNSALIYELAVLKNQAEPLLFGIGREEPEYEEARRLLKFLSYFTPIDKEEIPKNSILREFIGGSYFPV